MTEFIFITASDIHISDINPRSRTDNFKETVLGKIAQIRVACNKLNADGCLIAGDLYNLKSPAQNSHQLNRELIGEFNKFDCPVYMIEGNHDLTNNHLGSLSSQPLGVIFESGSVVQLREKVIEKEGHKVSLIGLPYMDDMDVQSLKIPDREDGCIAQICLMHIYASPTPGMLFKEKIHGYRDFVDKGPDIFVIGHYHIDQGIIEENGKYFVNLGSITRGTIADEDISHHPKIGLIKISVEDKRVSINAQALKLKIRPAEEVFNLEKRQEEQEEREEIEVFVEKLISESCGIEDDKNKSIDDIICGIIESMSLAEEVKKRVMGFISGAIASK